MEKKRESPKTMWSFVFKKVKTEVVDERDLYEYVGNTHAGVFHKMVKDCSDVRNNAVEEFMVITGHDYDVQCTETKSKCVTISE